MNDELLEAILKQVEEIDAHLGTALAYDSMDDANTWILDSQERLARIRAMIKEAQGV